MKRRAMGLAMAALLLLVPVLLVGCGEEEEGPPVVLQQQDREQVAAKAEQYVKALQAQDLAAAQAMIVKGVPQATVQKSLDTVRSEGFTFVSVGKVSASGQNAEVLVTVKDKTGKELTKKLEFRQEDGVWVVYSPHLKPVT